MLYIPNQLRVGYRNDVESCNGKLGYVIHMDNRQDVPKGWERWRDKSINSIDIQNVPTTGFKLVKAVGGGERQAWIRVYDPRGFEFEISVDNLLNILESSDSNRKELEGEFVYSWNKTQLILLPVDSIDYRDAMLDTTVVMSGKKFTKFDLTIGHTCTFKNKKQYVYMGNVCGKYHRFYDISKIEQSRRLVRLGKDFFGYFYHTTSLSQLLYVSDGINDNWEELSHQMQFSSFFHNCTSVEEIEYGIENKDDLLAYITATSHMNYYQPIHVKCCDTGEVISREYEKVILPHRSNLDCVFEFRFEPNYHYKFKGEPLFVLNNTRVREIMLLTIDDLLNNFHVVYLKHNLDNGNYYFDRKLDDRRFEKNKIIPLGYADNGWS